MAFDAKSSLCGWFFMLIVALLLWYRNSGYDRIYSIYAILIALILLILYGVHSGMDPLTSGRMAIGIIFVFCTILFVMVYNLTGMKWTGIISLIVIFILIFLLIYVINADYRIDITCQNWDPPYWISNKVGMFVYVLIFLGLLLPLIFLLANQHWSSPELYVGIVFMIVTASVIFARYKSTQALSVWFYTLTILIIFFWVTGMITPPSSTVQSVLIDTSYN